MTVVSYDNNQKNPLFRQAFQIFRIVAHPSHPHANRTGFLHISMLKEKELNDLFSDD